MRPFIEKSLRRPGRAAVGCMEEFMLMGMFKMHFGIGDLLVLLGAHPNVGRESEIDR